MRTNLLVLYLLSRVIFCVTNDISIRFPSILELVYVEHFRFTESSIQFLEEKGEYIIRTALECLNSSQLDDLGWREDFSWTFDRAVPARYDSGFDANRNQCWPCLKFYIDFRRTDDTWVSVQTCFITDCQPPFHIIPETRPKSKKLFLFVVTIQVRCLPRRRCENLLMQDSDCLLTLLNRFSRYLIPEGCWPPRLSPSIWLCGRLSPRRAGVERCETLRRRGTWRRRAWRSLWPPTGHGAACGSARVERRDLARASCRDG